MKEISSSQNPVIKNLRQLTRSGKARAKNGQTVLEGIHLCKSYLGSGGRPALCLIDKRSQKNVEVREVMASCHDLGVELTSTTDHIFSSISTLEHGIGVMMIIEVPNTFAIPPLNRSSILLDAIQDPGNAGTMLRTAAAAGIRQAYFSKMSVDPWSPKVLRAGMGAHFHLTIFLNVDLIELLAKAKIPTYATSLQASQSIYDIDLSGDAAWVMGNEGQGIDQSLLDAKTVTPIIIPQSPDVESLNVAAATAVCLFEHRRQRELLRLM